MGTEMNEGGTYERALAYHVLRYEPNLVRDEWVNIGVLVFDPASGERRLRLIEEAVEFARVRRLHPQADEALLRALRDDLEDRFARAGELFGGNGEAHAGGNGRADWLKLLGKLDDTLSNALQLAPQKGVYANDLDAEAERLYADHVAPARGTVRVGLPGSRAGMETGAAVGPDRKGRARGRVHLSGRSDAHRLRLPAEQHARFRTDAERGAGAGRGEVASLHGGTDPQQGEVQRIHGRHRRASDRRKRAAQICPGRAAARRGGGGTDGWIRGVDGEDEAVDSVRQPGVRGS